MMVVRMMVMRVMVVVVKVGVLVMERTVVSMERLVLVMVVLIMMDVVRESSEDGYIIIHQSKANNDLLGQAYLPGRPMACLKEANCIMLLTAHCHKL